MIPNLSGETVLVTGASGFLGGVIVRQLSEAGVLVKALVRRPERDIYIRNLPSVEVIQGDITDAQRLKSIMLGVDRVIHSAAALGGSIGHQTQVNVEGTRNVAQAAAEQGIKRFVHISTISVYGYRNRTDVTEETPYNAGADAYHITKINAEKTLIDIAQQATMPYSIIRPGMIYGARSNAWTKTMFNVAKRGVWIGDGSGSAYPIHVEDVAQMALIVATHPNAVGEAFNCTPDPSPTWREFLGGYAALAGRTRWIGIPPTLLRPIAPIIAFFAPKHAQAKDLPDLIPFVTNHISYKMDKSRQLLNWQPQIPLTEGIRRCEPYLREKGLLA
jgi:nucleoside-diphosphate-sugar epimerase